VQDYEINFDYTGGASCGGDTVRIYTASGFDQAWTPNTAAALVTNDWDHVGARKMAVVRPAPARITGSISVPPALELSYNTAFTLTVDVHSTASPGILRNPSVTLSVPPGMQVVPGSARIEYPLGTLPRSVTGTFLPALNTALGMGSNLATTRTFTLNFDHINNNGVPGGAALLMPGSLAPGVTAGQQTARFTVNFLPMCQTTLAGLRFSGVYNATSSCGAAAQWNGLVNRTRVIYTDVPINYHFSATVQTATGNRAFNELRRRDTLVVELQKTIGVNEDMQTTDSLHLVLPATMDLDGFVTLRGKGTMQAGVALFTPTAADGGIIAGERHINISLPIAAYNAEASKGWGAGNELIYRIPVIYTPAGQTMALNPVNQIEASVQTNASINELICPDQRAAIGGGDVDIALVTALRNPDRIPTGFARPFEITSAGFAGNWYADSLTATTLATAATTYTPAALSSCNSTKVYVSSEFGGVNYGRVPLLQISKITALNDTVTTASGIPHILAVVANDTLPAGCAPDTVDNRGPRHGTLVINADRTFTYTPDAAFAGIDSLNYYIRCETDSSAARVYMAVIKPGSQNYVVCPSASIKIEVATAANVHYYWYDAPTDGNILASGSDINFINFTKIGDATESVWVEARWNNIIFPRHRIDVLAGTNCGGAPSGCLTTGSLVWKEDFDSYGSGDRAPDPGWKTIGKTTYTYQTTNNFGVILPAAGNYALLKGRNLGSPGVAAWFFSPLDDHTSPTDNTTGYFLNFDATKEAGRFYEFEMTGLCEGTDLTFSAWLMNINPPTWTPAGTYVVPIVEFVIEDMSGNVLGLFNTGEIPRQSVATWVNYAFPFTVPFGVTAVKVKFINAQLNATGTIGNDISIDDIEVRLCAPEVEISKPKSDTVICAGSSITFEGNYTDDGTFGVYGGTLKAQWIHSADDDMSNPNAWNFVGSPVTASGSISSTYTIPSATSAAHTGYYRMVVANDGSPDNFNSWNCRAMSEVIYLNVIESIIPPDIRVYVKPSATALHLSSYIDSLPYPYTLSWLPSADFSADERGSLDVSSWTAPRTATYKYTVNSASCGTFTAKAYVHVINRYNKTETIYICKDLLLSNRVNLNRIFGIEDGSGGAWTYPNDPDLVTQDNVTIVATGRHAGARIFNAVQAYIDASAAAYDAGMPNNKKFEIRYSNGNITKTVKLTVY
jgi:hypothetical protein